MMHKLVFFRYWDTYTHRQNQVHNQPWCWWYNWPVTASFHWSHQSAFPVLSWPHTITRTISTRRYIGSPNPVSVDGGGDDKDNLRIEWVDSGDAMNRKITTIHGTRCKLHSRTRGVARQSC